MKCVARGDSINFGFVNRLSITVCNNRYPVIGKEMDMEKICVHSGSVYMVFSALSVQCLTVILVNGSVSVSSKSKRREVRILSVPEQ